MGKSLLIALWSVGGKQLSLSSLTPYPFIFLASIVIIRLHPLTFTDIAIIKYFSRIQNVKILTQCTHKILIFQTYVCVVSNGNVGIFFSWNHHCCISHPVFY